ncbi:MAG: asparagine synthase (glutamine-hydrolyzing) [Bacteroidia bacterium]
MCGIAGFFDTTLTRSEADATIENMLQAIAHRGPDARGTHWNDGVMLGHNRLSIIDLSEAANQPMFYNHLALIFNGEIYNYVEIKDALLKKGYQFKTHADTEVVLASYLEWGSDCVKQFMGMWSLVIYDSKTKKLFASRDRFGIKPFYYIMDGNKFYFASEFKALKQTPVFKNDLNYNQISRGLQMGWLCYDDETYFEKIKSLPASCNLIIDCDNLRPPTSDLRPQKYWELETGNYSSLSFEEKRKKFFDLFSQSVSQHMRSDVPVGSCLSGGLDSSAIVSMVQGQNPNTPYKSFSVYYEGKGDVDERPFINEVLRKYPAIEPFYKSPTDDEVKECFHHALYHADVPSTGSSFISQYFLMKLIGENKIKVVLDGQGSDEYLAGYMHTFYRLIGDDLKKLSLGKSIGKTNDVAENLQLSLSKKLSHFAKSMLTVFNSEQSLYALEYKNYFPFLSKNKNEIPFKLNDVKGTMVDNFLYQLLFTTSLPSLLQFEDRNSMAFSIESRVPFLDHRLVEFAFTLRNEDKIKGTETKYILRKALADVLPDAITNRKDKKGFVTPGESKWLRGPLKHLLEIDYNKLDFLQTDKVKSIITAYQNGDNSKAIMVWRIATLNYWIKSFV